MPPFEVVLVDECHHAGAMMYQTVLRELRAGQAGGPFLIGLTATPWRPDDTDLREYFGEPVVSVDLVTGLRKGFLTNVDYRMYTDNINWEALHELKGKTFSPRAINRTLFINQWDDAVVYELQAAWKRTGQAPRDCLLRHDRSRDYDAGARSTRWSFLFGCGDLFPTGGRQGNGSPMSGTVCFRTFTTERSMWSAPSTSSMKAADVPDVNIIIVFQG